MPGLSSSTNKEQALNNWSRFHKAFTINGAVHMDLLIKRKSGIYIKSFL